MKLLISKLFLIIIFIIFIFKVKLLIKNDYIENLKSKDKDSNIENFNNVNSNKNNSIESKKKSIKESTNKEINLDNDEILFQDYGTTNYIHPNNMTDIQKYNHKKYFPNNMTLQDYVNWLLLNSDNIDNLEHIHTINLQKLFKNVRLLEVPINEISNENHQICDNQFSLRNPKLLNNKIHNMNKKNNNLMINSSIILPSNYVNYSDYRHNFDVYGLNGTYINQKKDIKNFRTFTTP